MPAPRSIIARLFRFGVVGGVATLIHAVVLFIFVEHVQIGAKTATVLGYMIAGAVSYFGHYYITFRSTERHRHAVAGFIISAISGAALNVVIFAIVMDGFGANYWVAFAWVIIIVPGVTYGLAKKLAFDG